MKHLYRIDVEHSAPKDTIDAIAGYVIVENEEKLYNYLSSCGGRYEGEGLGISTGWEYYYKEGADDNEIYESYDDDIIYKENWKEKMIRLKGELGDESRDYSDLYYGKTYYGWTDLGEVTEEETEVLLKMLSNNIALVS